MTNGGVFILTFGALESFPNLGKLSYFHKNTWTCFNRKFHGPYGNSTNKGFSTGCFTTVVLGGSAEVDLERGESDVGEEFTPQILAGYYTARSAPTEAGETCQRWLNSVKYKAIL